MCEKADIANDLNLTIQNNCYWRLDGDGKWVDCNSLEEWREKYGQEMLDGKPVGICMDPLLRDPGTEGYLTDPTKLPEFFAYMISESSPCINAGLNLKKQYGINNGEKDFYGNPLPTHGLNDIGIHQFRT